MPIVMSIKVSIFSMKGSCENYEGITTIQSKGRRLETYPYNTQQFYWGVLLSV